MNNLSGYYGLKIKIFTCWRHTNYKLLETQVNEFLNEHDGRIHDIRTTCTEEGIITTIIYEE